MLTRGNARRLVLLCGSTTKRGGPDGRPALAIAAAVFAVAACGGDDSRSTSIEGAAGCLRNAGAAVSMSTDDLDIIAAQEKAVRAELDENGVIVILTDRAAFIEDQYRPFLEEFDVPVEDVLVREDNAVLVWDEPPSDAERDTVVGCLNGGGVDG